MARRAFRGRNPAVIAAGGTNADLRERAEWGTHRLPHPPLSAARGTFGHPPVRRSRRTAIRAWVKRFVFVHFPLPDILTVHVDPEMEVLPFFWSSTRTRTSASVEHIENAVESPTPEIEVMEPCAPTEALLRSGMAERIILLAFVLVTQNLVGLVDLLELRFVTAFLVGMVLVREFAVCLLDVVLRGTPVHAQYMVWIHVRCMGHGGEFLVTGPASPPSRPLLQCS